MTHSENTGKKEQPIPSLEELSGELRREKFRRRYRKLLRSTIYALVVVAAVSVLIATLLLPVLQIYGTSHESQSDGGRHCGFGEVTLP